VISHTVFDTTVNTIGKSASLKHNGCKKGTTRKASTFALSVVFFLFLALLLPADVFDFARLGGQECSKPDLITGFIHLPKKRIVWKQEGFSAGSTNSAGFLDYEHQLPKAPGVCRIAMLGDSMTEALQVPQESRFSNLLEHRLNAASPGRFEVFNFGISAAGTGQEYLTYLRYVEQYKPDITILFFDSGDEDKNLRKPAMGQWYPHAVFRLGKGQLGVSFRDFDSWLHSAQAMPITLFEDFRRDSRFWGTLIQIFNGIKTNTGFVTLCTYLERCKVLEPLEDSLVKLFPLNRFGPPDFHVPAAEVSAIRREFCSRFGLRFLDAPDCPLEKFNPKSYEFASEPEYHAAIITPQIAETMRQRYRERWQVLIGILTRFSAECDRTGSKFIVIGFPTQLFKDGFAYNFQQIAALADRQNFHATNLTQAFDAAVALRKIESRYVSHLTPSGHKVMADLLYNYLEQEHFLEQ